MAESASSGQRWTLTEAAFNKLLICLDPDRARAGEQYEMIRRKLVKFFEFRGSLAPEDYADETINRVAQKVDQGETLLNPSSYFHGVARMIFMESLRAQEKERLGLELHSLPTPEAPDESERLHCLRQCLQQFSQENRELVVQYYEGDKGAKIDNRQKLADRLKIPLNALRIRACRLRKSLEECVRRRLKQLT